MPTNPDNKRRSDGKAVDKTAARRAKAYKATGKLTSRNMEVGNGSWKLSMPRLRGMLGGDDD